MKEMLKKNHYLMTIFSLFTIVNEKIKFLMLNDKNSIEKKFFKKFGYRLDLDKPVTFNEKLQWLKLNDRSSLYTSLVDKYEVRNYVEEKIGGKYLNKLYGIYDNIDDIKIEELPEKFVLKTTHDSGGIIICKDKKKINWKSEISKLKIRLKQNYYYLSREYHYKNVIPRVICEEFLEDPNHSDPLDYKIFCFNGVPKFIQVDVDRNSNHTRNFYDINWVVQDFQIIYDRFKAEIEEPSNLSEMLMCAKKLSKDILFCRVDLYSINNRVVFGEITFFPEAGFGKFSPSEYDEILGGILNLEFSD